MINPLLLAPEAALEEVTKLAQIVKEARNLCFVSGFKSSRGLPRPTGDVLQMSFEGVRFP
jgi:hypothetical protein